METISRPAADQCLDYRTMRACLRFAKEESRYAHNQWIERHHQGADDHRVEELKRTERQALFFGLVLGILARCPSKENPRKKLSYSFLYDRGFSDERSRLIQLSEVPSVLFGDWIYPFSATARQELDLPAVGSEELLRDTCPRCFGYQPIVRACQRIKRRLWWGKPEIKYYILCLNCRKIYELKKVSL